jgi:hypothetical protein
LLPENLFQQDQIVQAESSTDLADDKVDSKELSVDCWLL